MKVHALYRFFDSAEQLLYVGITMNPTARWPEHRRSKAWWCEVATITLETFDSRKEVLDAEQDAIKTEHPLYNVMHNAREVVQPAPLELVWTCVECCESINDGQGAFWIDQFEFETYHDQYAAWRLVNPGPMYSGAALLDHPTPVLWNITHDACAPDSYPYYDFAVEDLRTPSRVLARTAHLMDKRWLPSTNWDAILRAAAQGGA